LPEQTLELRRVDWARLDESDRRQALCRPATERRASLTAAVADIVATVRAEGDAALYHYARQFDGVDLEYLRVPASEFTAAEALLPEDAKAAIHAAVEAVRLFHEAQRRRAIAVETAPGVTCRRLYRAIQAVGLYVPAGSAPLPSTVVMLAVPAAIAGCPRCALATPPRRDGRADPAVLYAAHACGVDEVWLSGGAQAVAALAYGTESVAPVQKLFGPGNAWVTEAKLQVSRDPEGAALDLPAGPSELLVIADDEAQPAFVAADLLSQAEHGADSQVMLVTPSAELAAAVERALAEQLTGLTRADTARASLAHARIVLVPELKSAFDISNRYAPEHLVLQLANAEAWLPMVTAAGSVFLGDWTPETLGDYCSGTNHVLPTYGHARAWSGLSVDDFELAVSVQTATTEGLAQIGPVAETLARLEGLDAHANAVRVRLDALAAAPAKRAAR
jgi:histidinol dehydrogenase